MQVKYRLPHTFLKAQYFMIGLLVVLAIPAASADLFGQAKVPINKPTTATTDETGKLTQDPLFKSRVLDLDDVYPARDVVQTPAWLYEVKGPLAFSFKPFFRYAVPAVPLLDYYDQSGMDLFSGDMQVSGGVQIKSPIAESGVIEIEGGYSQLSSSGDTGVRNISKNKISGTTTHSALNIMANMLFYPADNFFFGFGGGLAATELEYTFTQKEYIVDGKPVAIKDGSTTAAAPQFQFLLGMDIPLYAGLRAQIYTSWMQFFFKDNSGGHLAMGMGVSYNFGGKK